MAEPNLAENKYARLTLRPGSQHLQEQATEKLQQLATKCIRKVPILKKFPTFQPLATSNTRIHRASI